MRSGGAGGNNNQLPGSLLRASHSYYPNNPPRHGGRGDKQAAISLGTHTAARTSLISPAPGPSQHAETPHCLLGVHSPLLVEGPQVSPRAPQRGRGGVSDHGFVFQPAEPRCLSDKLSAVNIERRCGGEQAERLGGCSSSKAGGGWDNQWVGASLGTARSNLNHLPLLWRFSLLMAN